MSVKKLIGNVSDYFFMPTEMSAGIVNFKTPKFYIALCCYLASIGIFVNDPFFENKFGEFSYQQGGIILLAALIIMASVHWEMLLFGRPAGANLLLQALSLAPFGLFYARIVGESTMYVKEIPIVEQGIRFAFDKFNEYVTHVKLPAWLTDMSAHRGVTIMLVFILLILCLRSSKIKAGGLLLLILIQFFIVLNTPDKLYYLLAGTFFLAAGLALQFNNYAGCVYYLNIMNKLQEREKIDKTYLRTIMRIMKKIREEQKITENEVISIVKSEYGSEKNMTSQKIRLISSEILRNMMNEFNLLSLKITQNGVVGMADGRLYRCDNILAYIAILPRIFVVMIITLLCLLSPVDLIPDGLPLVGMLDDVSLSIVSFWLTKNSLEVQREK